MREGWPSSESATRRRALALARRRGSSARNPATIVAVTGTSGKTSVAAFTARSGLRDGEQAASIGTIGLVVARRGKSMAR